MLDNTMEFDFENRIVSSEYTPAADSETENGVGHDEGRLASDIYA